MPTIRDTIDPTRERVVSDEEATDLERQHVVLTGTRAKTPEGLREAAVRQVLAGVDAAVAAAAPPLPAAVPDDEDTDEDTETPRPDPDDDSNTDDTLES